ncbi:MAG: hypothetical protein ABIF71_01010 [Planctomycetota bacterium]
MKDEVIAALWYEKAAIQGYASVQFDLGNIYVRGMGTENDFVTAFKWWTLAAEGKLPIAKQALGELSRRMSPAELEKGRLLVDAYKKQFVMTDNGTSGATSGTP